MNNGEYLDVSTDNRTFNDNNLDDIRQASPEGVRNTSLTMAIGGRMQTAHVSLLNRNDMSSSPRTIVTHSGTSSSMNTVQTATAVSNNSEVHNPVSEDSIFSCLIIDQLEGCVCSGVSYENTHYRIRSVNVPNNMPILIQYQVHEVEDESAAFHNVLPVPNHPGYKHIASPFVDVPIDEIQYVQVTYANYRDEIVRERSFESWPRQTPSVEALVTAGMFYQGAYMIDGVYVNDAVVCYKCGMQMSNFDNGDDPAEEHRRLYPRCSVIHWQ